MARLRFELAPGRYLYREGSVRAQVGKQARVLKPVQNRIGKVAADSLVTIAGAWRSGFSLEVPVCKTCGVSLYVSQVHRDIVAILAHEENDRDDD